MKIFFQVIRGTKIAFIEKKKFEKFFFIFLFFFGQKYNFLALQTTFFCLFFKWAKIKNFVISHLYLFVCYPDNVGSFFMLLGHIYKKTFFFELTFSARYLNIPPCSFFCPSTVEKQLKSFALTFFFFLGSLTYKTPSVKKIWLIHHDMHPSGTLQK